MKIEEIKTRTPGEQQAYIQGFSTGWAMAISTYDREGYEAAEAERQRLVRFLLELYRDEQKVVLP